MSDRVRDAEELRRLAGEAAANDSAREWTVEDFRNLLHVIRHEPDDARPFNAMTAGRMRSVFHTVLGQDAEIARLSASSIVIGAQFPAFPVYDHESFSHVSLPCSPGCGMV